MYELIKINNEKITLDFGLVYYFNNNYNYHYIIEPITIDYDIYTYAVSYNFLCGWCNGYDNILRYQN